MLFGAKPGALGPYLPTRRYGWVQLSAMRLAGDRASPFRTALGLVASHSSHAPAPLPLTDRFIECPKLSCGRRGVCLHCKRYHGLSCMTVSERRFLCEEPPFAFEDDGNWRNVKSPKTLTLTQIY